MKQYLLCTLSLLFLVHLPLAGQDLSRKFGRITDYEIDMTTYQRDTSAVAVCLYENTNVLSGERHYSTKIKILKPDGVDLANVEIPYIAGLSAVTGLSVSAYNRVDGKVVQTKLKNSEVRTEQVLGDLYIRKFAIPEVRTGTVIEYKYTISSGLGSGITIQKDYPVIYSSATAHVSTVNRLNRFDEHRNFGKKKAEDRLNEIRKQVNIPVAVISDPSYREDKSPEPSLAIEYDLETPGFGSCTGERLFVPAISFRTPYPFRLGRTSRKSDICVQEGFCDVDITDIVLRGKFETESLPSPVTLECKYGSYSLSCRPTDDGIVVERRFLLRTGTYDKQEFDAFKEFIEKVARNDNSKIVLNVRQRDYGMSTSLHDAETLTD